MKIIKKFNKPTMFDDLPYGSVVKVCDEEGEDCKYYIQSAVDGSIKPKWISSSELFEKVSIISFFLQNISDSFLIEKCLDIYHGKKLDISITFKEQD